LPIARFIGYESCLRIYERNKSDKYSNRMELHHESQNKVWYLLLFVPVKYSSRSGDAPVIRSRGGLRHASLHHALAQMPPDFFLAYQQL
jgi:hypothetical protein